MEKIVREIKYRAWDRNRQIIVDVAELHWCQGGLLVEGAGFHIGFAGIDCDLIEYTGLYDKAGVEIYEGDIVRFDLYDGVPNKISEVKWKDGGFFPLVMYALQSEVIGNIYENPELMEKGKDDDQ